MLRIGVVSSLVSLPVKEYRQTVKVGAAHLPKGQDNVCRTIFGVIHRSFTF